jgi:hypothetical protein
MQRPLGRLVVPKLLVPARTRHLVGLQLDVAHGRNLLLLTSPYLSREARGEALAVELIGLNEGRKVVGVRRWHNMQWVFIELQISLLPNSETLIETRIPARLLSFSLIPGI